MEIKTKKLFKELVKKLTMELLDEESLEEITTTGDVAGYLTPFAFSDNLIFLSSVVTCSTILKKDSVFWSGDKEFLYSNNV